MHTITNMKGGNCPILPLVEDQRVWLEVEAGTTRKFLLHLPATSAKIGHHRTTHNNNNKNKDDAFKGLLVLFHGLGDECENFLDATGFVAHAAQHGFAVASACGLSGYLGRAWNAGVCCGFNEDGPDEVAFARAVVESVSAYTCINFTGRAMAAGFSNGAMLAEMIGCTAPDVFSAVASVGGVTALRPGLAGGLKACDDAAAVHVERPSVLLIHGDDDPKVPWSGRTLLRFPDIPTNVARWAARSGCPARNTTTLNTTHFVNAIYSNCGEDDGAVEIVRHKGGHHQWPMTDGFDTTAYIVGFGLHHGWSSTSSTHTTRKRS